MKEINDVDRRISAYIEFKGGDSVLAKKTGRKPQVYQAVRKFRIKAGRELLDALSTEPDFDLNYAFKGIKTLNVNYPAPIDSEIRINFLNARIKELEEDNLRKNEIIKKIEKEKQSLFNILGKHEGMTESLLFDTKYGSNLMYALLGSKVGHALANRMQ